MDVKTVHSRVSIDCKKYMDDMTAPFLLNDKEQAYTKKRNQKIMYTINK